jgi:hypothetical protein
MSIGGCATEGCYGLPEWRLEADGVGSNYCGNCHAKIVAEASPRQEREARLTDDEVMALLRGDTPLNRARAIFSGECGRIEQAAMQRRSPSPVEIRRMEFEAVRRITAGYVTLCAEAADALAASQADVARLTEARMDANWEAFGREIMKAWPEGGVDGFDLQDLAEKHGIIKAIPGGFDPATCDDALGVSPEPGDPWFLRNYAPEAAPSAASQPQEGE